MTSTPSAKHVRPFKNCCATTRTAKTAANSTSWSSSAAVREAVYSPPDDPAQRAAALANILQFVEIYKNVPLLKEYHGDVWLTLERLAARSHEPRGNAARRTLPRTGKTRMDRGGQVHPAGRRKSTRWRRRYKLILRAWPICSRRALPGWSCCRICVNGSRILQQTRCARGRSGRCRGFGKGRRGRGPAGRAGERPSGPGAIHCGWASGASPF